MSLARTASAKAAPSTGRRAAFRRPVISRRWHFHERLPRATPRDFAAAVLDGTRRAGRFRRPLARAADGPVDFQVQLDVVKRELDPDSAGSIRGSLDSRPGDGRQAARRDDDPEAPRRRRSLFRPVLPEDGGLGKVVDGPRAAAGVGLAEGGDGVTVAVADVTPGWHGRPAADRHRHPGPVQPGRPQLADGHARTIPRTPSTTRSETPGAPGRTSPCRRTRRTTSAQSPGPMAREPDGTLLVPLYFGPDGNSPPRHRGGVPVRRRALKYLSHGDELRSMSSAVCSSRPWRRGSTT